MVDTGAPFSVFPVGLLDRLEVRPFTSLPMRFADGRQEEWQMGHIEAKLESIRRPILCLFGSDDAPPLIGAHALEAFLLTVEPVEEKLARKEAFLM